MSDLISRQQAIDDIRTMNPKDAQLDIKWVEMWLKQLPSAQPTIDAVEVVRCKDCKWWNTDFLPQDCGWCEKSGNEHGRLADWFCKDGERKEE